MSYVDAKARHYRKQRQLRERSQEVRRIAYERMTKPIIRQVAEQQLRETTI